MRVVLIVLAFALTLYALLDCARTPEEGMPARMPKFMWIVLIVLFPTVGPIAWIIVSRVKAAEERGGYVEPTVWSSRDGTALRRPERRRPLAPDEDPEFLRNLEQDIRRRRHHSQPTDPGAGEQEPRAPRAEPGSAPQEGRGTRPSRAGTDPSGGRGRSRAEGTTGARDATREQEQDSQSGNDEAAGPGPANGHHDEDTTREP